MKCSSGDAVHDDDNDDDDNNGSLFDDDSVVAITIFKDLTIII